MLVDGSECEIYMCKVGQKCSVKVRHHCTVEVSTKTFIEIGQVFSVKVRRNAQ